MTTTKNKSTRNTLRIPLPLSKENNQSIPIANITVDATKLHLDPTTINIQNVSESLIDFSASKDFYASDFVNLYGSLVYNESLNLPKFFFDLTVQLQLPPFNRTLLYLLERLTLKHNTLIGLSTSELLYLRRKAFTIIQLLILVLKVKNTLNAYTLNKQENEELSNNMRQAMVPLMQTIITNPLYLNYFENNLI